MRAIALAMLPVLLAGLALAEAPKTSPRPLPRPQLALQNALHLTVRPKPRPQGLAPMQNLQTVAAPPPPPPPRQQPATMKGAVCGNPQIKGIALKPIKSRIKGCNVAEAVQVSSVAGVTLSPAAVINCAEAQALATWVVKGVQPAFNNTVTRMTVADSYSCRSRNNVRGAKVSEHGAGNAIDISAFSTSTGKTYTVASNYNSMIRAAQKAGCGIFHTILGPGSDGYHETHIHFDVAPNRGSPYCR